MRSSLLPMVWALACLWSGWAEDKPASEVVPNLHAGYDRLLRAYVKDGVVDYAGLKKAEMDLDGYLAALAGTDPAKLDRNGQLALWINAYNAFTLKLILRKYPGIRSIKEIPRRWDLEDWEVGGKKYSLDQIEHKILRKMGDPRIHFAIVCAAKSCPDLPSKAFLPGQIDEQLDAAGRRFLGSRTKGLAIAEEKRWFGGKKHVVRLSKIFSWFSEDFEEKSGSVEEFVLPYAPKEAQAFLRAHKGDLNLSYLDYDWSLNGR